MSPYNGGFNFSPEDEREDTPWETEGDCPFLPDANDDTWDADEWPEDMAGPEYWFWLKHLREEGDDDDSRPPPFQ